MDQMDLQARIDAATTLIEDRLDEDVPLEELARAACYSMFHFHRLFRATTGETVRQYARRLRMERAAYQLTFGTDEIVRIAFDAGYDSHEAFTRAFKAHFDITPSAFRDERREVCIDHVHETEFSMEVQIRHRDPVQIAYVRHVGPYDQAAETWKALMKWGWMKLLRKPEIFGLSYDDPEVTDPDEVRYEACMVVDKAKPKGNVQVRMFEGGDYAVVIHEGPYENFPETYNTLCARITSEPIDGVQYELAEPPALEKYLNDPRKTKPEDLRTEVWMPVRRA